MEIDTGGHLKAESRMGTARHKLSSFGSTMSNASYEPAFVQLERKCHDAEELPNSGRRGTTTTFATGMNLVTTMVGAGILGFPATFRKGGFCMSIVVLLLVAWSVVEVGNVMAKTLKMCEHLAAAGKRYTFGTRPEKYEDLCEAAFGHTGKRMVSVMVVYFTLMICGVFMILIGNSLEFVSDGWMPYRAWVLAIAVFFVPLTLVSDMSFISRLAAVGVAASVMYVVCIAKAGLSAGMFDGSPKHYKQMPDAFDDLGSAVAVMLLGFSFQMTAPTVRAEMDQPDEFPRAVSGSVGIVSVIYLLCGALGYFGWGDGELGDPSSGVKGNVLLSMKDMNGNNLFIGKLLACAVIANLCVTFPILMNCISLVVENAVAGGYSVGTRLALLACSVCVGLFCPFFLEIVGLLASVLGVATGVLIPLACYWKICRDNQELNERFGVDMKSEARKHSVILALGLGTMIIGTLSSGRDLLNAFEQPDANPFTNFWKPSG